MKKIKLIIMSAALLLSIGGAVATRANNVDCTGLQNYYWNGTNYAPTGVYGHDFICMDGGTACTYYQIGGVFTMCRAGAYFPVSYKQLKAEEGKQTKK